MDYYFAVGGLVVEEIGAVELFAGQQDTFVYLFWLQSYGMVTARRHFKNSSVSHFKKTIIEPTLDV